MFVVPRRPERPVRWTLLALVVVVLIGCGKQSPRPSSAAEVIVESVVRRDLPLRFTYPARVSGSRMVEVRAQVDGRIVERTYTEGQSVKAGDVLFRIDPAPYRAAFDRAGSEVAVARAEFEKANREVARLEPLAPQGLVSHRDIDQVTSALTQARAALAAAEATRSAVHLDLEYSNVRAPMAGTASKEQVTVGNLVDGGRGGDGDLLTTIVQADPAYVEFAVPESEYLRLRSPPAAGSAVLTVSIERGSRCERGGVVDFVDSFVSEATDTARARAVFDNPDGCLVSGQFLSIVVRGRNLPDTIAVPKSAVWFSQRGPAVWIVDSDQAVHSQAIQLGESWENSWVVRSGLEGGEHVIVEGILKARAGSKVAARSREQVDRAEK